MRNSGFCVRGWEKRNGSPSFAVRATTENKLITNALVLGGILLSLGLIAVSAALNFRMAYRMGGTELDGWVYGSGAAIADGLKALLPFFVWWAWRKREWLAVGAGVVLFVVFTAYSFTAGMGYIAKLRAFSEGVRASAVETRAGLRDEESRIEARLEKLGVQRGEEEISAELEAVFARVLGKTTVGAYSENCTLARNWSRHSCARAAELRQELARAMEAAELEGRLHDVRGELRGLGSRGAGDVADPQLVALEGMAQELGLHTDRNRVRLALLVLVGLLFELGSGLGLYVSTVPWRGEGSAGVTGNGRGGETEPMLQYVADAKRLGDVEEFALECLAPEIGSKGLTSTAMFQEYAKWCRGRNEAPLVESEFVLRFEPVIEACNLKVRQRGANVMYMGVKRADAGAAAT